MTERLGDGLQNHLCQFDSDSTLHSPIAQLVEQLTVNQWVAGSSPAWGATKKRLDNIVIICYNYIIDKLLSGEKIKMFVTEKTEEEEIEYQKQVKKITAESLAKSQDELAEELPRFATDEEAGFVDETRHDYTIELLYHFNCGSCEGWWSYATTPGQPIVDQSSNLIVGDKITLSNEIEIHCPHCGHYKSAKIKDGFFDVITNSNQEG